MKVHVLNVELRGIEQKTSNKTGNVYFLFYFEEVNGNPFQIVSKNITDLSNFKKSQIYNITCDLNIGKFTVFELIDIQEVKKIKE